MLIYLISLSVGVIILSVAIIVLVREVVGLRHEITSLHIELTLTANALDAFFENNSSLSLKRFIRLNDILEDLRKMCSSCGEVSK